MADDSGSNAVLGVVVGAIIIGVLILFFVVGIPGGGGGGDANPDVDVTVDTPAPAAPATPDGG